MKKSLLIATLLFSLSLSAQDYIPMLDEANNWGLQSCFYGNCGGVYIVQITGEQTINGKTYKHLNNESCLLREEDGVVYVLNDDETEDVFLDFTLEVGDSFFFDDLSDNYNCFNGAEWDPEIDEFRITAVETQNILGQDRKVFYMDYYQDGVHWDLEGYEEIWIEGIGSSGGIGPRGFIWDVDLYTKCFTRNGETIEIDDNEVFPTTEPCEETTAGVDEFLLRQISMTPNPVSETAVVTIPLEIPETSINVFDINGKQLFEKQIATKDTPIDFSSIRSGLYFYQIFSKNELLISKKLLVR